MTQLVSEWKSLIFKNKGGPVEVDILGWFSRTSLDAIGSGIHYHCHCCWTCSSFLAAFNYEFGALDNEDSEICRTFRNLS